MAFHNWVLLNNGEHLDGLSDLQRELFRLLNRRDWQGSETDFHRSLRDRAEPDVCERCSVLHRDVFGTRLLLGTCPFRPHDSWPRLRLFDEEEFLAQNLPGYTECCAKVRWHLVPGIF